MYYLSPTFSPLHPTGKQSATAPAAQATPGQPAPPSQPTEADRIGAVRESARAGLPGASSEGAGVRAKGAIPTLDTYWRVRPALALIISVRKNRLACNPLLRGIASRSSSSADPQSSRLVHITGPG